MPPKSYLDSPNPDLMTLNTAGDLTFDEGRMSAKGLLTTTARDRDGDIVEVTGIDTTWHKLNPVVLLDHGKSYGLPIGITEDPDGNYTVIIDADAGEATQETFFDQKSEFVQQIYHLYCSKMLRGNSVQFKPLDYSILPADLKNGHRSGRHIKRCQLMEVSWTALPCNQEAVTSLISKGMIGSRPLEPQIKSLLTPYILESKVWSPGATMEKSEMSSVDSTTGGSLRPDEGGEEKAVQKAEPFGAEFLRGLHGDLSDMLARHGDNCKRLENPKVGKLVSKVMENLQGHIDDMEETFGSEYPDSEALGDGEGQGDSEEDSEGEEEVQEPGDAYKSATKKDVSNNPMYEGEKSDPMEEMKSMLGHVVSMLEKMCRKSEGDGEQEQLAPEEMKMVKSLEKAIARKERMLSRFIA
jgi:hypothetical protein